MKKEQVKYKKVYDLTTLPQLVEGLAKFQMDRNLEKRNSINK